MRLAWLLVLIGCKDLPDVASETCGNAVVEVGEDCDLFSDPALGEGTACGAAGTTEACRYLCDPDGTPRCPRHWGCGADGVCRYPSGDFREVGSFDFPAEMLALADVDGDGQNDLIGGEGEPGADDAERIEVRYGAGGDLVAGPRFPAPGAGASVGDVDQDGRADVVAPAAGGLLVLTGQAERTLAPLAFSSFTTDELATLLGGATLLQGGLRLVPVRVDARLEPDLILAFISASVPGAGDFAGAFFFADSDGSGGELPELRGRSFNDLAGGIEVGDIDGDGSDELALAFQGDDRVRVYTLFTVGGCTPANPAAGAAPCLWCDTVGGCYQEGLVRIAELTLPAPVFRGVELADGDGDGDLDLFVSVDVDPTGTVLEGMVRADWGGLAFGALAYDLRLSPGAPYAADCGDAAAEDRSTVFGLLAAGRLDGDADEDFVTPMGIYRNEGTSVCQLAWNPMANFEGPLGNYREAALGDVNHDGVPDVVAARGELPGLDVWLGDGAGRFFRHFLETELPPTRLRVADYDGDLVDDVAFAEERWRDGVTRGEALAIVYGNVEGAPSPPVTMGRLQYVTALEPARLQTEVNLDGFADLLVHTSGEPGGQGTESVALLFGSPDGRMLSVFGLSILGVARGQPYAALIGRFAGDDPIPDLGAAAPMSVWRALGSGMGQFNLDDLDVTSPAAYTAAGPSRFHVVDLDGDGVDEVVGSSDSGDLFVLAASAAGFEARALGRASGSGASGLLASDLDGDGALELVAAFRDGGVVVYRGFDGATLPEATPVTDLAARGVVAVNADRDGELELAIVTTSGLFLAQPDGAGGWSPPLQIAPNGGISLVAGDLDGDGLHELIVGNRDGARVLRAIPEEPR